jgi:hypothetical protein
MVNPEAQSLEPEPKLKKRKTKRKKDQIEKLDTLREIYTDPQEQ